MTRVYGKIITTITVAMDGSYRGKIEIVFFQRAYTLVERMPFDDFDVALHKIVGRRFPNLEMQKTVNEIDVCSIIFTVDGSDEKWRIGRLYRDDGSPLFRHGLYRAIIDYVLESARACIARTAHDLAFRRRKAQERDALKQLESKLQGSKDQRYRRSDHLRAVIEFGDNRILCGARQEKKKRVIAYQAGCRFSIPQVCGYRIPETIGGVVVYDYS